MWTKDDVQKIVTEHPFVIFGKGTKTQPMCGFTARAIQIAETTGKPFEVVNIFEDPSIKPALVEHTQWPTTPQVFVGGEFLGGSDVVMEMLQKGELQPKIDGAFASRSGQD